MTCAPSTRSWPRSKASGRWPWLWGLPVRDRPRERRFPRGGHLLLLRRGCRRHPIPDEQRALSRADWEELFHLSHVDPRRASDAYTRHYLATDGQLYWSDLHQMADYHDGYHLALDGRLGATSPGSEMITELYVPRRDLPAFMAEVAQISERIKHR